MDIFSNGGNYFLKNICNFQVYQRKRTGKEPRTFKIFSQGYRNTDWYLSKFQNRWYGYRENLRSWVPLSSVYRGNFKRYFSNERNSRSQNQIEIIDTIKLTLPKFNTF